MRKTYPSLLGLLVSLTASAGLVASQDRRVPADIRVRVTEVPVDVIVVDHRNRPVLDLKKEDFLVLEDNVPQTIVHFSVESYAPRQETSAAGPATTHLSIAEGFVTSGRRTFLIVMGRGRHQLFDTIPQLIDFVREGLHPTDRVAFMAYNRATDFVTDPRVLVPVIERYGEISPSIESKIERRISGLGAVFGRSRSLSEYRGEIDRIFDSEAIGTRSLGSADMVDRYIDGEKHIVFFNEQGLALARVDHEQGLAARASDARVRVHAVQTGGVQLPRAGARFNSSALLLMKRAAGLTGGQSFSHSHVLQSLHLLEEMTAASYLLGYVPEGDQFVGEFAVSFFLFDRSGNLRDETWGDLRMTLGPERYRRVVRDGFPVEMNLQVPSDLEECVIRAVVYHSAGDRTGSAEVRVRLDQ